MWRDGLWLKLWEIGVRGKVWRIIEQMYEFSRRRVLLEGDKHCYKKNVCQRMDLGIFFIIMSLYTVYKVNT